MPHERVGPRNLARWNTLSPVFTVSKNAMSPSKKGRMEAAPIMRSFSRFHEESTDVDVPVPPASRDPRLNACSGTCSSSPYDHTRSINRLARADGQARPDEAAGDAHTGLDEVGPIDWIVVGTEM